MAFKSYGWKRGPKVVSQMFEAPHFATGLPTSVDLEPECPPVYDQEALGSCTAQAGAGLAQFLTRKLKWKDYTPSRLAIYYWERVIEGTVSDDSGATLADCMKVLRLYGAPNETLMPYTIAKFRKKPAQNVINNGKMHLVTNPVQVRQTLDNFKSCLASGYPFIFGFTVHKSFESNTVANTGIMSMPGKNDPVEGGHAVMCVGFDDKDNRFKVRNSWGHGWGVNGYFYMPYDYMIDHNLASDFWTAKHIKGWRNQAAIEN